MAYFTPFFKDINEMVPNGLKDFLDLSDDIGLWPRVREDVPDLLRAFMDEYSSSRSTQPATHNILRKLAAITYQPLPKDRRHVYFRLLKILPHQSRARIQCELEQHSFHLAPDYQALSYCWGTEDPAIPIICNGSELLVTPIVGSALSRLRLRGCQYIWIDALCINQQDLKERQQQVQIMQQIYLNASEVCIWLANDTAHNFTASSSVVAFELLRLCSKRSVEGMSAHPAESREEQRDRVIRLKLALRHVLTNPWFDRIWCVQEAVMNANTTVISGSNEISWETFHKGLAVIVRIGVVSRNFPQDISRDSLITRKLNGLAQYENPSATDNAASYLLKLLIRYRMKLSTDPRDKAYALFGLVKHFFDDFDLIPSYEISVTETYKMITAYILRNTRSLHVLAACNGKASSQNISHYSWVPDWSCVESLPDMFQGGELAKRRNKTNDKMQKTTISFSCDDKVLGLQGWICDVVEQLGDVLPLNTIRGSNGQHVNRSLPEDISHQLSTAMDQDLAFLEQYLGRFISRRSEERKKSKIVDHRSFSIELQRERRRFIAQQTTACLNWRRMSHCRGARERYTSEECRTTAFWQTLCAGKLYKNYNTTAELYKEWDLGLSRMDRAFNPRMKFFIGRNSPGSSSSERQAKTIEKRWAKWQKDSKFAELLKYAYNRRFARTSRGYFCLVPASTKQGDLLGIFKGSDMPLIIREYGEEWQLVGQSYVHDIMKRRTFDEDMCKTFWFR